MLRHARGCLPHQVSQLVMLLSVLNRSGWPVAVLCYRRRRFCAAVSSLPLLVGGLLHWPLLHPASDALLCSASLFSGCCGGAGHCSKEAQPSRGPHFSTFFLRNAWCRKQPYCRSFLGLARFFLGGLGLRLTPALELDG